MSEFAGRTLTKKIVRVSPLELRYSIVSSSLVSEVTWTVADETDKGSTGSLKSITVSLVRATFSSPFLGLVCLTSKGQAIVSLALVHVAVEGQ
jgi:hypothetical protein